MRSICSIFAISLAFAFGTNCATIFSDSQYDYNFESEPSSATVTIQSRGNEIARITTPGGYKLDLKNDYTIKFELEGYETHILRLQRDVDLWIIANIVCTGGIGIAVDALTGAISKPDTTIIKWRFERKKSALRGVEDNDAMTVQLEFTGNNERTLLAEFDMQKGSGERHHNLNDLIQTVQ